MKLLYFGHLMQTTDSLEKSLMLGKIEGKRRGHQEDEMAEWHHDGMNMNLDKLQKMVRDEECCSPWVRKELDTNG